MRQLICPETDGSDGAAPHVAVSVSFTHNTSKDEVAQLMDALDRIT